MWDEFFPISIPTTAIAFCAVADIACSFCLGAPGQLIAGGAGARPDHSISGRRGRLRHNGRSVPVSTCYNDLLILGAPGLSS